MSQSRHKTIRKIGNSRNAKRYIYSLNKHKRAKVYRQIQYLFDGMYAVEVSPPDPEGFVDVSGSVEIDLEVGHA